MTIHRITVLPGDGIGPEVIREAVACLELIRREREHDFRFETHPMGGAAFEAEGDPLPDSTLAACLASDAVLLGAVGGPAWDQLPAHQRPESGLLRLRKALGCFANLRPVAISEALVDSSPLKAHVVRGTDLLIVRELAGGLYYGEPRSLDADRGVNTMAYSAPEVERVARVAFEAARRRGGLLTSVDKANVLEASRLWRATVDRVAADYPGVKVEHQYVDSAAMLLVTDPTHFDVILTENLFGDILSDEAAVLGGTLGILPSASLGGPVGLYEPVHGSAPALTGKDVANPIGAIASAALLLRHSLGLEAEAGLLEQAIADELGEGFGTPDLKGATRTVGTAELGERIRERIYQLCRQGSMPELHA
ncbi:MAG TPA: 3-isopropylmalate dehydrogenase [Holophagaceae bacterium]|nr:3-isopropylmalate dehydrogenase [Holophagaceae bacterium]